jgi:prolyl-tRNA synthetase
MKDLYSFTTTMDELEAFYDKVADAYQRIFATVGLGEQTFKTFASGGAFSKFSHEFQTVCEAGEDTIYLDRAQKIAVNHEVYTDDVLSDLGLQKKSLEEVRAVEVGNIFKLGTRFSEALGLNYTSVEGQQLPVVMGSYGIGPARVMAAVVECLADEAGMVWPKSIAPFDLHLIELDGQKDKTVRQAANELCNAIHAAGHTLLHDERDLRAGEKFAESDLIGLPLRVVVSKKTVAGGNFEVKDRQTGEVTMMSSEAIIKQLQS